MIENIDIWRAAEQMQKLYGADAAIRAAMRADKLMDQDDVEGKFGSGSSLKEH